MGSTPGGGGTEILQVAARVRRAVHPEAEGSLGIVPGDGAEVHAAARRDRHRDGTAAAEGRPHLVGRVRERRVQDGVA